jgi:hypothetical protein
MTEPRTAEAGWAFLVARGRRRGYRTILAPAFVADRNEQGVLTEGVRSDGDQSRVTRIDHVVAPTAGPLTLTYRTHRLLYDDLDATGPDDGGDGEHAADDLVTDDHGRPLDLLYGFVLAARNVDRVDEADLRVAKDQGLQAYRRFLADEDAFTVQTSQRFPLRSLIQTGEDVAVVRRRPAAALAGHRDLIAGTRAWNVLIGVLVVAILGVVLTMWFRSRSSDVDAPRRCELREVADTRLGCSVDVEVKTASPAELRSIEATVATAAPSSRSGTIQGIVWDVDESDCRDTDDDSCALQVEVTAPADAAGRELRATLTIGPEDADFARTVELRATQA